MGGSSSTTTIIQQNVQPPSGSPVSPESGLMAQLFKWLNQLLKNKISVTGDPGLDTETLSKALETFTFTQFQNHDFGYIYAQQSTKPKSSINSAALQALDDFVNVAADDSGATTQYINNVVIGNSSFPRDVQIDASSELNTEIQTILQGGISNGWQTEKYHRTYDSSTDKSKWAIDATFTFTVVLAVDYAQETPSSQVTLFLRFAGVTYQTA